MTKRYGLTSLARHLNERGYRFEKIKKEKYIRKDGTEGSKDKKYTVRFNRDIVRSVLENKTYIGYQNTGKHLRLLLSDSKKLEPIIDEVDFNKVAEIRKSKSRKGTEKNSRQKRVYLLQGLIKSSACGNGFYGAAEKSSKGVETRRYLCKGRKNGQCKCPSVRADMIEYQIIEFISKIRLKSIERIEIELRRIIKISARAISEAKQVQVPDSKHREQLKALEEISADNDNWRVNEMVNNLRKVIKENEGGQKVQNKLAIKYYDFIELRNVLLDMSDSFKKLQNLTAKKDLINILFGAVCMSPPTKKGTPKQATKKEEYLSKFYLWEQLFFDTPQADMNKVEKKDLKDNKYREVMEFKYLLQYFIPALFEEVLVEVDNTGNEIRGIACKPSGLFLLLFDSKGNTNLDIPLYRMCMESLPTHHLNTLMKGVYFVYNLC